MLGSMCHLFLAALWQTINAMGTSPLGLISSFGVFLVGPLLSLRDGGVEAMKQHFGRKTLIGVGLLVVLWAGVFVWQATSLVYSDHISSQRDIRNLESSNANLSAQISNASTQIRNDAEQISGQNQEIANLAQELSESQTESDGGNAQNLAKPPCANAQITIEGGAISGNGGGILANGPQSLCISNTNISGNRLFGIETEQSSANATKK
jgi:hypothetical protein